MNTFELEARSEPCSETVLQISRKVLHACQFAFALQNHAYDGSCGWGLCIRSLFCLNDNKNSHKQLLVFILEGCIFVFFFFFLAKVWERVWCTTCTLFLLQALLGRLHTSICYFACTKAWGYLVQIEAICACKHNNLAVENPFLKSLLNSMLLLCRYSTTMNILIILLYISFGNLIKR